MSVVLNGSSQYLYSLSSPVQKWPLTISVWFKAESTDLTGVLAAIDRIVSAGYKILGAVDASGSVLGDPIQTYHYDGSVWSIAKSQSGYQAGVWVHACGVFAGRSIEALINGGSMGIWEDPLSLSPQEVVVGARRTGNVLGHFQGKVAEVAVWDVALDESDVALLAGGASPLTIRPESQVRYWPLLEDELDYSGHDVNLTRVGDPSFDVYDHPPVDRFVPDPYVLERLADMPEPKEQFGFEELNGVLYAVCGVTTGAVHSKTVYAYDIATGTWSRKADALVAMQSPILRAVNGKLYLIGGYDSYTQVKYDTCYEYDPVEDTWAQKADMPMAREDMGSAVVGGKIYVFGGLTNPGHTLIPSIDIYDPATDTWETRTWISPRTLGDFGVSCNGKIYLMGGTADMSEYPDDLRASYRVDEYDPADDTWSQRTDMPMTKCYSEVEELGGFVYVLAGTRDSTTDYNATGLVYDMAADDWTVVPNMSYAARGIGMAKCDSSIYVAGGYDGSFLNYLYRFTPGV